MLDKDECVLLVAVLCTSIIIVGVLPIQIAGVPRKKLTMYHSFGIKMNISMVPFLTPIDSGVRVWLFLRASLVDVARMWQFTATGVPFVAFVFSLPDTWYALLARGGAMPSRRRTLTPSSLSLHASAW